MVQCTLQVAVNNGNFQNATNQSPNRNQTEIEKIILTKYTFLMGDGLTSQKEANRVHMIFSADNKFKNGKKYHSLCFYFDSTLLFVKGNKNIVKLRNA